MADELAEWQRDREGKLHREAARIVFLDSANNVFLELGHDADDPLQHQWWFTVGGGKLAGESYREAACREAYEETGWKLMPQQLEGPVLRRHAEFKMLTKTLYQSEYFYICRLPALRPQPDNSGFTEMEKQLVTGYRWWSLAELEAAEQTHEPVVYPLQLGSYLREWIQGWNGETPEIHEGTIGPTR